MSVKEKRKLKPIEYRELCHRCMMEYKSAGIPVRQSGKKTRVSCFKCGRQGMEYITD